MNAKLEWPGASSALSADRLVTIDPETFRANFHARPFLIRHHLADHPLLTLSSLIKLAQRMPEAHVEYNAGNLPVNQEYSLTPRNGLSIEETIRRIEECSSWMVLKFVHQDPVYGELLSQCLDQIQLYSEVIEPGMGLREGYIFISSPSSVTPYHIDNEHNFLLQIRGTKTVYQWDPFDRTVLSELQLENFYSGGHRNQPYKDEYASRAFKFNLTPGIGLHFPINCPHWVKNGPEVSISFSITFRTPASDRRALAYQANAALRGWGIIPSPVGSIPWRDALKVFALRVWNRTCATLSRTQLAAGKKY